MRLVIYKIRTKDFLLISKEKYHLNRNNHTTHYDYLEMLIHLINLKSRAWPGYKIEFK